MAQQTDADFIQNLQDTKTPFGVPLAGIYKRSYAYVTIKDRLPVILTKVIDTLSRDKEEISRAYGKDSAEDIKQIVGAISKLKNEVVTNKVLLPLAILPDRTDDDAVIWNEYLEERTEIEGKVPKWFNTIWLYCECYMYRRLAQEFALTKTLYKYDQFRKQKEEGFLGSMISISALSRYTVDLANRIEHVSSAERKYELIKLIKMNLWGNRCDLSLGAGTEMNQTGNPMDSLESLEKDIIVDDTKLIWDYLSKNKESDETVVVDIVLDNAGYELFTDLCLAVFLVSHGLAQKIRFYVKRIPWYVSDATADDFCWTVKTLQNSADPGLSALGAICANYLMNRIWTIEEEQFWTLPCSFSQMKKRDPALYAKLSEAYLIVMKGDLNYRKLLGDINWEYTTDFVEALQGFTPANILSLRTVKCDVCVGLAAGKAESLSEADENWMISGRCGLIQSTVDSCPCDNVPH